MLGEEKMKIRRRKGTENDLEIEPERGWVSIVGVPSPELLKRPWLFFLGGKYIAQASTVWCGGVPDSRQTGGGEAELVFNPPLGVLLNTTKHYVECINKHVNGV